MKRIFLTSGLVLCMACPAFATGFTGSETSAQLETGCVQANLGVFSGSSTLTAQWTPLSGTVTLDDNYYYDAGNVVTYSATTGVGPASTLYTQFGNADGTAGAGVYTDTQHNSPITNLTTSTPLLTGYTFGGFNSKKDGTGTLYISNAGAISPTLADFGNGAGGTLYAQWTPVTYTITYTVGSTPNTNQAPTLSTSTQSITFDAGLDGNAVSLHAPLTADGYTFAGWKSTTGGQTPLDLDLETGVTGTETIYGDANSGGSIDEYKYAGNPTLVAQWTANTYTVTYSCGTGSERSSGYAAGLTQTGQTGPTFNESFTFQGNRDANGCYKLGYHFKGWDCGNTVGKHSTTVANGVATGDQVTWLYAGLSNGATIQCVAEYDENEIGLTWNVNNGSFADGEEEFANGTTCNYNGAIVLPENPTRPGYDFAGWQVTTTEQDTNLGTQTSGN